MKKTNRDPSFFLNVNNTIHTVQSNHQRHRTVQQRKNAREITLSVRSSNPHPFASLYNSTFPKLAFSHSKHTLSLSLSLSLTLTLHPPIESRSAAGCRSLVRILIFLTSDLRISAIWLVSRLYISSLLGCSETLRE